MCSAVTQRGTIEVNGGQEGKLSSLKKKKKKNLINMMQFTLNLKAKESEFSLERPIGEKHN